jgi:hypothetical protein
MPIDYSKYHPKWSLISRLIRFKRAHNKCEWCGIHNGSIVKRNADGTFRSPCYTDWDMIHSRIKYSHSSMKESLKYHGFSKIVLTVAHIDHNKNNNRFFNLAALCQKCHLNHDIKQHTNNRKYGRDHKGDHQLKLNIPDA